MTEGTQKPMSRQAMLKQPYPLNMLLTLLDATTLEVPELTDDVLAGLEYALSMLTDREREVLHQRYEERNTYSAIGATFHVTTSTVQKNEYSAFRKLRHRQVMGYILYGKDGFAQREYTYHFMKNT